MTSLLECMEQPAPGLWPTPLSANLIAQARRIGMPRGSPDGRWVAYVESYNGRSDLWISPNAGGRARLVSADAPCVPGQDNAPFSGGYGTGYSWTPDSAALVYTGGADGQLYHVPRDGGRATRVTDDRGRHLNPQAAPDGSYVVCVVDRGDVDDQIFIGLYDLRGPTPVTRRLTPPTVVALDPSVSPNGRHVVCVLYSTRDRWAHHSQIALIELETGGILVLTPTRNVVNVRPRWSPDGQTLAFLSDRGGYLNAWTMSASGGEPTPCAPEECEHIDICWSPDGRRLAYLRNYQADVQIMLLDLVSGTTRQLSAEPGAHRDLTWSGGRICALHQSPQQAPNVITHDSDSGTARQLIDGAIGGLADPDLFVMPEHVSWRSADGLEVFGLLFTPNPVVPHGHPALIHIHGGPTSQSLKLWDPVVQYFVSRGWVVLQPNHRGSTGYGRHYADLLHEVWGQLDLQDNATSVGVIRDRGLLDERHVVAWGGSAGGYATLASLTMTRGIYAAGVALYGITDWTRMRDDADRYIRYLADTELGPMASHLDRWGDRSPVTHAAEADGPLLIFQGTDDARVPKSQSDAMVEALRRAGKTVFYQVYEGEGHGWRRCTTVQDYVTQMEVFLIRYVFHH